MQIIIFISAFLIAFLLLLILIRYSTLIGINDVPNGRSFHDKTIPRSGGIAIFCAFIAVQLFFNFDHFIAYIYIYTAISLIFIIGFLDDKFGISPLLKFIFILLATIILYMHDIKITSIGEYFGYDLVLPVWAVLPFTFFAIAGFTNSMNLMDGLDGLAGSISIVILLAFLSLGLLHDDTLLISLSSSLMASIIAFLIFNWNPAKIFMGDSGSLTIGFIIALLSIFSLKYISPISVVFIIALPLLDTFIVMTRRMQRKLSIFLADKNHVHHFLFNLKGDVPFSVILLASLQAVFTIIGYQLRDSDEFISLILFALLFFVFLNLFDQRLKHRRIKKISKRKFSKIRKKILRQKNHTEKKI